MGKVLVPRPEHVHVGHLTWQIDWLNREEWAEGNHAVDDEGLTIQQYTRILIRTTPQTTESSYQEVLLHEIQHAIWCVTYLKNLTLPTDSGEREEAIVGVTSGPLLGVLQTNPHVVKYLLSDGMACR